MTHILPSQQWIVGICSIVFDIDVGQRVEHLVPDGCLSKEEQQDVAFHSFPDSMSMELHARTSIKDSTFFFRVRHRGALAKVEAENSGDEDGTNGGATASATAPVNGSSGGEEQHSSAHSEERFLYGFVFCRQRQDASLRRGGEQVSVVVLADHPLSSVLLPLSAVAGHQYFGAPGRAALQQVYDEVCRWPGPVAGPQLQLPVGFTALTARLPAWNTLPHPSTITALDQYGNNTLPHMRTSSVRSLPPSSGAIRRTVTEEGAMVPPRTASGMTALSPASSTASGLLSPQGSTAAAASPGGAAGLPPPSAPSAGEAGALTASPFNTASGGQQGGQQLAVAPSQQQLERRGSSGGAGGSPRPSSSGAAGRLATAELGVNPGASHAGTGLPASQSSGTALAAGAGPGAEGSLHQISGLLADGCSPATVPMYSVPLAQVPQHQRSRSSVQVPSRSSSYAGMVDDTLPPTTSSNGSGSRTPHGQDGGAPGEEGSLPRPSAQAYRRIPSTLQVATGEGGAIHGAFHEVDLYTPLSGHLPRLWQLWEMALLGRALLLVAPTPGEASAGVAAMISLVAPLPYSPDFRPYYCIHDTAFSRIGVRMLPGPEARDVPTLLGVTNLYFIRALPHWPNVLSIGKREGAVAAVQPTGSLAASMFRANAAVQALRQRTQGASVLMSGHTEALWSTYKPLCRPDPALLQKLLQPKAGDVKSKVARIAFVNSDAIRRHFAELTGAFLSPFSRYFETDPDSDGLVPGWNSEEFLFGLRSGGVPLPQPLVDRVGSPSAAVELYARFASCLNFAAWFAARRRHVAHLIAPWPRARRHSEGTDAADEGRPAARLDGAGGEGAIEEGEEEGGIASWFTSAAQHLDEVKLIGLFFSVEQQLMDAQVEAASPDAPDEAAASVSRLQRELLMLFFGMPEELQLTCISSPARRSLLASLPLSASQAARVQQLLDMLQVGGK